MYVATQCDKCQDGKRFQESITGGFAREDSGKVAFKQQKDEMGEDGDNKGMWLKEMKECSTLLVI